MFSLSPLRKQVIAESTASISPTFSESPPALPPKKQRANSKTSSTSIMLQTPPSSPKHFQHHATGPSSINVSTVASALSSQMCTGNGDGSVHSTNVSSSSHNRCSSIAADATHHNDGPQHQMNSNENQLTQSQANDRMSGSSCDVETHGGMGNNRSTMDDDDNVEVVLRNNNKQQQQVVERDFFCLSDDYEIVDLFFSWFFFF